VRAAHLLGPGSGLLLAQKHSGDLLFPEAGPFQGPSPFEATDFTSFWRSFRKAGQFQPLQSIAQADPAAPSLFFVEPWIISRYTLTSLEIFSGIRFRISKRVDNLTSPCFTISRRVVAVMISPLG